MHILKSDSLETNDLMPLILFNPSNQKNLWICFAIKKELYSDLKYIEKQHFSEYLAKLKKVYNINNTLNRFKITMKRNGKSIDETEASKDIECFIFRYGHNTSSEEVIDISDEENCSKDILEEENSFQDISNEEKSSNNANDEEISSKDISNEEKSSKDTSDEEKSSRYQC